MYAVVAVVYEPSVLRIGDIPPREFEQHHYDQRESPAFDGWTQLNEPPKYPGAIQVDPNLCLGPKRLPERYGDLGID